MSCSNCGSERPPKEFPCTSGPHYAELRCQDCGKWIKWVPKPPEAETRFKVKRTVVLAPIEGGTHYRAEVTFETSDGVKASDVVDDVLRMAARMRKTG